MRQVVNSPVRTFTLNVDLLPVETYPLLVKDQWFLMWTVLPLDVFIERVETENTCIVNFMVEIPTPRRPEGEENPRLRC